MRKAFSLWPSCRSSYNLNNNRQLHFIVAPGNLCRKGIFLT
ncbi:hypothetical protein OU5_2580 [Pseudomonas mandelii JR-1]|uniref:Uncharacterized protein n=1 Tax=Pseudomonas mandelii JR-1 TaxID=1147786 RepID=A0A024E9Q5_9PSED|nr:hypothetical protein OU5_2580 [Pseudomonas mandelii JR-1]